MSEILCIIYRLLLIVYRYFFCIFGRRTTDENPQTSNICPLPMRLCVRHSAYGLLLFIFFYSCHTTDKVRNLKAPLKAKGEDFIFEQLKNNYFDFNTFSAKMSIKLLTDGKTNSFNVNLKMKKDSIIWLSISPALGLEIFRIIIINDSVIGINRINSTYFVSDFNYLNNMFLFDFDFNFLQNIIVGNPCLLYESPIYKASIDKEEYLLHTYRTSYLKKNVPKEQNRIIQKIWINPENFKVSRMQISDFKENQKFESIYTNFKDTEGKILSYDHFYKIETKKETDSDSGLSKKKPVQIFINFSKVYMNKELDFTFNIPEKYKRVY